MRTWLYLLTATLFFSSCSMRLLNHSTYHYYLADAPYDAVVVPGMKYDTATGQNGIYKARMHWAKLLYDSGITRNIIFSGGAIYTPYREGTVMKIFADSMGIPPANTFSETEAMHSNENVYYGFKMARALGFEKVAVATDPFQALLYGLFIKSYDGGLPLLTVGLTNLRTYGKDLPPIDAWSAYAKDFAPKNKFVGGFIKKLRHSFSCKYVRKENNLSEKCPQGKILVQ